MSEESIENRKSFALFVALYETLEKQGCENISSMIEQLTKNDNGEISDYYKELRCLRQQLTEKDKEIKDLKDWNDWYSMWHKQFKKKIEDLETELETYRPTKLHGNGQCECYKCKVEGRQPIHWTDWCNKYKGHIYCDDCLKEILENNKIKELKGE